MWLGRRGALTTPPRIEYRPLPPLNVREHDDDAPKIAPSASDATHGERADVSLPEPAQSLAPALPRNKSHRAFRHPVRRGRKAASPLARGSAPLLSSPRAALPRWTGVIAGRGAAFPCQLISGAGASGCLSEIKQISMRAARAARCCAEAALRFFAVTLPTSDPVGYSAAGSLSVHRSAVAAAAFCSDLRGMAETLVQKWIERGTLQGVGAGGGGGLGRESDLKTTAERGGFAQPA
ncbi:unnamed protein product [Lampetra planeri]